MAIIKCKMCGGDLAYVPGTSVAECEYCGTTQTVPSADNEKKLTLFNRANRLRYGCEFDKAFGVYEALVADFPEEAEAYWGLVLCKYGIEYVDDPATGKKIPTCHRSSFDSVLEDENFEQALENADALARKVYREEAKQIEQLRKDIIEVSGKEDPYDIFICYKETDENGNRTLDSVLAQDIYDALTDKGYRVFFSRITLEDKLGQEYEPYIFAALNSAKVMLAVGTDYEYYNAVWVKNEWSRFLQLMAKDKDKHLIPCYKNIDAYDMPKEFAKLQAQDLSKVGAMQDLLRGIDKLIMQKEPIVSVAPIQVMQSQIDNAMSLISDRSYRTADAMLDTILTADPKCAMAYIGKLMIEQKIDTFEYKAFKNKPYKKSPYYQQALDCGDEFVISKLNGFDDADAEARKKTRKVIKTASLTIAISLLVVLLAALIAFHVFYLVTVQNISTQKISSEEAYEIMQYYNGYLDSEDYFQWFALELGYMDPLDCTSISIPEWVAVIPDNMFTRYANLTSVSIPDSVTSIGNYAFSECKSLTEITLPDSITSIGDSAFLACRQLESITIPDGVTSIGNYAFSQCTSLTSITIPNSVTCIYAGAFRNCDSLLEITIPDSVTRVDIFAFANCNLLMDIYCRAPSKPADWSGQWNDYCNATVHWGVTE